MTSHSRDEREHLREREPILGYSLAPLTHESTMETVDSERSRKADEKGPRLVGGVFQIVVMQQVSFLLHLATR